MERAIRTVKEDDEAGVRDGNPRLIRDPYAEGIARLGHLTGWPDIYKFQRISAVLATDRCAGESAKTGQRARPSWRRRRAVVNDLTLVHDNHAVATAVDGASGEMNTTVERRLSSNTRSIHFSESGIAHREHSSSSRIF
jgi:hypothetical protein